MTPLKSSNLRGFQYDPASKMMTVHFNNGAKWQYHDVDAKHHDGLSGAESAGKYFNTHIRGHKATRVTE